MDHQANAITMPIPYEEATEALEDDEYETEREFVYPLPELSDSTFEGVGQSLCGNSTCR